MKTDYFHHELMHQQLNNTVSHCWNPEAQISRTIIKIEQLMRNAFVPKSGRLLEIGCGAGNITLWLEAKGYSAYGLDISPTAIKTARDNSKRAGLNTNFMVADITGFLDYPGNFFDLIIDGNLLHCIIGEDRAVALANIISILRPGGFFYIGSMCGNVQGQFFKDNFDPHSRCVVSPDGIPLRYVATADEILDEIKKAGFYILDWEVHSVNRSGNDNDYLEISTIRP